MKILNKKYKGTIWSNGKYAKEIKFDELTNLDVPFLEKIGMEFLTVEVCDKCEKQRCRCKTKKDENIDK